MSSGQKTDRCAKLTSSDSWVHGDAVSHRHESVAHLLRQQNPVALLRIHLTFPHQVLHISNFQLISSNCPATKNQIHQSINMKLATATVLCALAAASPALAAEKKNTSVRRLGGSDPVCHFLDFEGLWEGVDPDTGAIHNTELDCTDGMGPFGRNCKITIVVSYHEACGGEKTILTGQINGGQYGQFDQDKCNTENVCTLNVVCPNGGAPVVDTALPLKLTQSATTKAITSCVDKRVGGTDPDKDKACEAFKVTLNKTGGGWKS